MTASKIPVPDPMAPTKSAKIVRAPMHIPPKVAAMGIYLFNLRYILSSLNLSMKNPCSLKLFETSLTPDPETSIQVLLKRAHEIRMNAM